MNAGTLISVSGVPIITISPVDQYVLSGANASFYCVGMGDPAPNIVWQKNLERVKNSDRIKANETSGELRIYLATVEDAGTYECIYRNSFGEDRRSAMLMVDGQSGEGKCK